MISLRAKTQFIGYTFLMIISSCNEDQAIPDTKYPRLESLPVTEITNDGVTFNAKIDLQQSTEIIEYGFIYGNYILTDTIRSTNAVSDGIVSLRAEYGWIEGDSCYVFPYLITEKYYVETGAVFFRSKGSKPPVIDDISPLEGYRGSRVTLTGTFNSLDWRRTVLFGDYPPDNIVSWSANKIVCNVPYIDAGVVNITVSANGHKVHFNKTFTIL
jgi:hypothetical protein